MLTPPAYRFVPIVRGPFNKKASEDGKAASAKLYAYLDQYLADKTFLVGERISFADLITGAVLQRGCDHVVDPSFFNQYPNVLRDFNTVQRQPQVQKVQGKAPSVIEKPKEYVPQAKEKKAAPAAAAAAPAAPKAAKASKKKEVEQDDEEEEPSAAAQEPKAKHPCEALGKAQLNLEDWKRKYSNEDTPVAMKWLEENLKPDEYSFWKVVYKYPEELTQGEFETFPRARR
jgi:elongation factor 1-gamma